MEKLTKNVANNIANELNLDNDNREIIAYGMFALMHMLLAIILVIIFGTIFNVLIEALIVCFAGSTLRKYSGGAHATSPSNCAIIGTLISVGQAILILSLSRYIATLLIVMFLGVIIFIFSYYLIYKLAPVDSASKPIKTESKKNKMRKGSNFILMGYIVIVLINLVIYTYTGNMNFLIYSFCIYGGTSWQVFTLTRSGHNTMNKIDFFLNKILILKRS